MDFLPSTAKLIDSIENFDVIPWVNNILHSSRDDPPQPSDLVELEQHITHVLAMLDIAYEDTSSHLERTIDDVTRSVPRLTYDLHSMKDEASSLHASLLGVIEQGRGAVPIVAGAALDHIRLLDVVKGRMESAGVVLREAESWSTLELEVTALLAEKNYEKGAERLSEASRSMVVFQNTPEYEARRMLMVNLQNQLEASLSSALVSAINTQDLLLCRSYFSIFFQIQRELEFRNYYNASRRTSVLAMWSSASLIDCGPAPLITTDSTTFAEFLPKFYASFLALLDIERVSIPAIFPDPVLTLSAFISSTLVSLQPSFSYRLSLLATTHGDTALKELVSVLKATEEFAIHVEKLLRKMGGAVSRSSNNSSLEASPVSNPRGHARRRSTRMSVSLRSGVSSTLGHGPIPTSGDGMGWDQELFQPLLDFQIDYGSLEKRLLEDTLHMIIKSASKEMTQSTDRAWLLKENAVGVFEVAEESLLRCTEFTHGYGTVGLVRALDNFFKVFINLWTTDVHLESSNYTSLEHNTVSNDDLLDMDYTLQDWSHFQATLHLLSSARAVSERIMAFENKLRLYLAQIASRFRLARDKSNNSMIATTKGESYLLEQSPLKSTELHSLLDSIEPQARDSFHSPMLSTGSIRHSQMPTHPGFEPLLVDARQAISAFAHACQVSLQGTILSPLHKHLAMYASLTSWNATGDPNSKHSLNAHDLQIPNFSLSPTNTMQRVAEGLLNLPRLFEVYAEDDALGFSLATLPYLDPQILKGGSETCADTTSQQTHMRRSSLSNVKPLAVDPDAVSSAWLLSLGQALLKYLTVKVLPILYGLST
ncbi:oligomeric Golgi complex subunit 7 [Collybia nuda]|uniref:Conserved oligomeric Golgi complex subunit 7 n=1 Tax=Collybia nuda TaxID=64659 RepID=A0A9P5YJJ4_9AGAR|nr:oligomeric Golgi complex subunit 7 [Collybia nuda]